MNDYKEIYQNNWKTIIENEDGTLNKDQVMRELSDYAFLLDQVSKVYSEVTGGTLSKTSYKAETVINLFYEKYANKAQTLDLLADDWDIVTHGCETNEDYKRAVFSYLEIEESEQK